MADKEVLRITPAPGERKFSRTSSNLRSKRKNPKLTGTGQSEAIREQQIKIREVREAKRARLDNRHYYILSTVAEGVGISLEDAEEFMLDSNQLDELDDFFKPEGRQALIFYFQPSKYSQGGPTTSKSGLNYKAHGQRLWITDGTKDQYTGHCVFFLRLNAAKAITPVNVCQEVYLGMLESKGDGLLGAIESLLGHVFIPALTTCTKWGQLASCLDVSKRQNFVGKLSSFVSVLSNARESIADTVGLTPCSNPSLARVLTPADITAAVTKPDLVEAAEKCTQGWCKEIEQILAWSEQMRREADDVGPRAELQYWKKRMAKFDSLISSIKLPQCRAVINILVVSKSKVLKQWKALDNSITDYTNEAKDNVKFLYTLDKYCEPLYKCNPVTMIDSIPGLMNAIRMIHSYSRYYNTSERMTCLFVKVTNQMITACKAHLTDNGDYTLWAQERPLVLKKLDECKTLYKEYQRCFKRTKEKIKENPEERQFNFSEMYMFGKFSSFINRCEGLKEMLSIIETYSSLALSHIEGIETLNHHFRNIVINMKKKTYDLMDPRKPEFETDFEEFKSHVHDILEQLQILFDERFNLMPSTSMAAELIQRFERLKISGLKIDIKYKQLVAKFNSDMDRIQKLYTDFKENPPLGRNLPSTSGRICWSRQLYHKLEETLLSFKKNKRLMASLETKKAIKRYNHLAQVLVEYECIFLEIWQMQINVACISMNSSVLVRNPKSQDYVVNFDNHILETIRDIQVLIRMGIEVNQQGLALYERKAVLLKDVDRVTFLAKEEKRIRSKIPDLMYTLLGHHYEKVEKVISPGLTLIRWSSLNLPSYLESVSKYLDEFELLIDRVIGTHENRISVMLDEIEETKLCNIPENEAMSIADFCATTDELCTAGAILIDRKNIALERTVLEMLDLLLNPAIEVDFSEHSNEVQVPGMLAKQRKKEQLELLQREANSLMEHYEQLCIESQLKLVRLTLEGLRKRLAVQTLAYDQKITKENIKYPLFKSDLILVIPDIKLSPSLDEVQRGLNIAVNCILGFSKFVYKWGQDRVPEPTTTSQRLDRELTDLSSIQESITLKSFYHAVGEHKEIIKLAGTLTSAIHSTKDHANTSILQFVKYSHLWRVERELKIQQFIEDFNPTVSDFNSEMSNYSKFVDDISKEPEVMHAGPIALRTEKLRFALITEAKAWVVSFGRAMNITYHKMMERVCSTIEGWSKKLSHPVKDLDDIRSVMATLKDIRENEIEIDMSIDPIEESYSLMHQYDIHVSHGDVERVDTLRYMWTILRQQVSHLQSTLLKIQPEYRSKLLENVGKYHYKVHDFTEDYDNNGPMVVGLPPREASEKLVIFQAHFDDLWSKYQTYTGGEELFGLPVTEYPEVLRMRKELGLLQKLYSLYNKVMDSIDGYYDIPWAEINIEKINNELLEFQNSCRKLPKGLREWQAYKDLKTKIDDFNELCPLLETMLDKSMKERHWKRIEELTKWKFDVDGEGFLLRHVMEAPLLRHLEEIEDICISATKEKDIESRFKQVHAEWAVQNLVFVNFKTRGELLLRGDDTQETIGLMEDSLMLLGSLLSNRYNAPFKKDLQKWVKNLTNSAEILENWLTVQNLWIYLEAVFVGGDIAKQLPKEAKRFQNIDKAWVKIMTKGHETPNVVQCCVGDETLGQLLPHLLEQLELCQKSLTGYLEKKRLIFPRFFFISDPALLEILGQASNSHTIQAHLLDVFDNVKTVTFHEKDYDRITHINSREPETIELERPVMAHGNVEVWLGKLLDMSLRSVNVVIHSAMIAIDNPNFELLDFLETYPAQIGLLGIQVIWTADATTALRTARSNKTVMQATDRHFQKILDTLIEVTTKNLSKIERTKFETLITIHLHQRDIFHALVELRIKSPLDFEWIKQTRFYNKLESDDILISITDVDFTYQNEFLGCTERLVITPLTDRCYITLAQALGFSMGGAPAGPAGTGKTETTKDMGKALGKYVVVFNCSDQMDFRGLGRIYKGLAQSGSWGCFDEFNRIELPVLSVAAQQIATILSCKKERKSEFIFTDGDVVSMNPEFGLFLTMNPSYAGRQELPENLKMNFRPIAMMVPDRKIIIRVKLASCGFLQNIVLSDKFYTLYKLCEDQLSKQVHYDFGLRNILSVLRTLGASKRNNPEDSEQMIVMRGLRDMNLSKLVDDDEPLFKSLINDLFPGIEIQKAAYPELEGAIEFEVQTAGLINHPPWNLKLIQLYETQLVRHGFMVLGPSGTGKTKCIHILMKAMTDCGIPHKEWRMNPKAITASEMFGRLDVATNDWTDGIFSTLWRRSHKLKKGEHVWLVMDGPVDTLWIENLNSVLDDNKTLTLANGDRIPMFPNSKLVFEPDNVDNASPATVSRNGMVYMSSSGLEYEPILRGWLIHMIAENRITQEESHILLDLYLSSFIQLYRFALIKLDAKIKLLECNYILQSCQLLEGLIPSKEEVPSISREYLEKLYIFSLMWSIGALQELNDRTKMEEWLRENTELTFPVIEENSGDTIFEFKVDGNGKWEHWKHHVEEYVYPTNTTPQYSSILVPNVDNVRMDFLIDTIARQSKGVLLIGEQGTAKTVIIKSYLSKYNPEKHLSKGLTFSSATQPLNFQRAIESYVDKRVGATYGPPAGKKCTVFIDDINMPTINDWGDQITNEIVRQLIEAMGFFNLDKPGEFTSIQDMQLLAAMIHPGGGRNDIPSRLKGHFAVFNCTLPSNASIDKIFGIIGLGHFCKERGFSKDVMELVKDIVVVTRRLWHLTKIRMLPTPAKFHYVFNLRDLSRIWEGMLRATSEVCNEVEVLLALWKHECTRVIADRFVSIEDTEWFMRSIVRVVDEGISEDMASLIPEEPYFVDFLRDPPEPTGDEPDDYEVMTPKVYELIPSYPDMMERLNQFQMQFNETIRGSGMDLVFFKDAIVHLIRISRIIGTDRGAALLVGVGGSGKQSLTRLASFIAGYKTFQIQLSRVYNVSNLLEDLKYLYATAGEKGQGIVFLFTDNEIKDECFLEYINNVLSSGEVSNLFARDEINEMCSNLIPNMKREFPRRPATPENLYDYFLTRARNNLHVVLCFSPIGEKFRSRSLKFPGLFSGCTMDWFNRWPKDALIAVAQHFVQSFDCMVCSDKVKHEVVQAMGIIQDSVAEACLEYFDRFRRSTYVTPKSYLSFINGYKEIYVEQKKGLDQLLARMNTGLQKLLEASKSVGELSLELEVKEKELVVASSKAEEVLKEVTTKAQAAEKVKSSVQLVKDKAQKVADFISKDKAVAEQKLEAAQPALEEAERALLTIKAADIATVRKLAKPPHLIMRITDCVLLLLQRRVNSVFLDSDKPGPRPSWTEALKMMSQTGFLQLLQNFPKDSINDETVELMEPYFRMDDYNLEVAKRVCGNVAGLCSWTKAMAAFFAVNKEVLPLKANLVVQEGRFQMASEELSVANAKLEEKEREVAKVRSMYEYAMSKKQGLEDDALICVKKMEAASTLIDGLSGEKVRWTEQTKEFKEQIIRLVGNVLLASAFLSYCGPFNQEFRGRLLNRWKKELSDRDIPFIRKLNLTEMLSDSATIAEWNLQGLPNDELSVQNGIIVTKATRFPLLIDPQGQAKRWIKQKEANANLRVTTLNNKYFRSQLEDCLSLGYPLIIEDVMEDLDPCLDNILEKNFIKSGSMLKVKVGDKEVDVMKGFILYITTKLPNPKYSPEVYARTAIIDFTVTMQGLEEQLLGRVILMEKNELEAEKVSLMEEVTLNKKKIKHLEDNLLYRLTTTEGSLIDDESLIEVLKTTKMTAEEVTHNLLVAAETEIKINIAREEYRPVATRGAVLYFLIMEMSMVNVMYQTSLQQFLSIFYTSIAKSADSPVTYRRISNITEHLTYLAFKYCIRGLYEQHKFLFTLLLALKIDMKDGYIKHIEFGTLIKGGAAQDLKACPLKPAKWISDISWMNLVELSYLDQFADILNQVARNDRQWRIWFEADAPELATIPEGYNMSLDTFRKLLMIRAWCADRVIPQALNYISERMGSKYAESVILDIEELWMESNPRIPMICLLSMGSDPTNSIEGLAKKFGISCSSVSMGQGQEAHARRLVSQCQQNGGWSLLQNTHLALDLLDELLITVLETEKVHESFRLWLTTEVHPQYPINFLQASIKYTFEPPKGVKASLKRTYTNTSQELLEYSAVPQWRPMYYSLAFLHTVVQERRKYGPLGWNIPYEYNQGDFNASTQYIKNLLDDMDVRKGVSWNAVQYMIGEIQYGGRVTDDYDKRLLNTYARLWFCDGILKPSFRFYKSYCMVNYRTPKEYLDYLDTLPLVDTPEIFGLHQNADIIYLSKTANASLDTILSIQPKDSSISGGETRETIVYRQAQEMLDKLPVGYIPHEVKAQFEIMGALAPMNIFLKQEIDRMQRVIQAVRHTLRDLQLAIEGTIIMSESLQNALDKIYDAKVPDVWLKVSWDSSTIGFWYTELLERDAQFRNWVFEGRPRAFWMTGFFNPQGFITAMRQEVARAHKGWALDTVVIHNEMTRMLKEEVIAPPYEGVYVYGLYLEGAAWDRRNVRLIESQNKILFSPVPIVHIFAVNMKDMVNDPKLYVCPVYKKATRTDRTYVTALKLRTTHHPDHWILRGVALLCDIK